MGFGAARRYAGRRVQRARKCARDAFAAGGGVGRFAGSPSIERPFLLEKKVVLCDSRVKVGGLVKKNIRYNFSGRFLLQ